jgi:homoserine acetyltransferase
MPFGPGRWLVCLFLRRTIVPHQQMEQLATRLSGVAHLQELPTRVGHDAFLVETAKVSAILTAALS